MCLVVLAWDASRRAIRSPSPRTATSGTTDRRLPRRGGRTGRRSSAAATSSRTAAGSPSIAPGGSRPSRTCASPAPRRACGRAASSSRTISQRRRIRRRSSARALSSGAPTTAPSAFCCSIGCSIGRRSPIAATAARPRRLERGVHALSNAPLGVEWPKTETGARGMRAALERRRSDRGAVRALGSPRARGERRRALSQRAVHRRGDLRHAVVHRDSRGRRRLAHVHRALVRCGGALDRRDGAAAPATRRHRPRRARLTTS